MNRKKKVGLASFVLTVSIAFSCTAQNIAEKLPFEMPQVNVPVFKTDTFNIKKFGAINDGITLNTKAINNAIEACAKNGGGVVYIPSGLWVTGPIVLRSNVNLHLVKGALVLFSRDINDYPLVNSYFEGLRTVRCQAPVSAENAENIAITGGGVINGAGDAWRPVKKSKLTQTQWTNLIKSGGVVDKSGNTWYPSEKSLKGYNTQEAGYLGPNAKIEDYEAIKDFLRPVMIGLVGCKNVLLDGVTFQNSPSWCVHPLMCEHFTMRNVNVSNPWYAQNGDGIDIESCRIGTVTNCTFDVGDDALCIKSGKNEEGRKRNKPTELFVISNCEVYHGHGGFVIGSEMSGGVRNLYVSNCTFLGTDIGLRFKTTRGRGGIVENIYISDISMINIPADAIGFDMYYGGTSPVPEADEKQTEKPAPTDKFPAVNEGTPQFRNLYVKNISCNGAQRAIFLQGLPEMYIRNINLENISIKATTGLSCIEGQDIHLKNVNLEISKGDIAAINNSKNVDLENITGKGPGKFIKVSGKETEKVNLKKIGTELTSHNFVVEGDVKAGVVLK